MRRFLSSLAVLLLAGVALAQSSGTAADRAYIEKAESDWAETVATHDCSVLERILADDFVGVDVDGSQYDKAAAMKSCKSPESKFASNHLDSVKIRFYGDTAIAQGSESWKLKSGRSDKFVWTDTWLKRNGKWQIVAAEDLIPVPSPFGDAPQQK